MKSDKEEERMDWYLDLWTKQPMKASVLMEILLLLIVAGILTCFILIRWRRKCKEEKDKEISGCPKLWNEVQRTIKVSSRIHNSVN